MPVNGGTGGLLTNTWIKSGPGTVTNSVGSISIISNNSVYTSAAQGVTVRPGKLHRFSYTGEGYTFSRKVGAAQEGDEYIPFSAGVLGEDNHLFTPTTNTVWVQFQRLSANTATASDLRLTDLQPPDLAARSLNGTSQMFWLDNGTYPNAYPMLNANFYIGGWWKLNALPSSGAIYFYDFGTLDTDPSGGRGRVRLVYDAAQNRLVASNMATTVSGYREHYLSNPGLTVGAPVYLGVAVKADGDVYPVVGTRRGGGVVSGSLPTLQSGLGQQLRIGATARITPPAGTYVNGSVWDVVWHVGSIPSDAALDAMAAGQRPHQIGGFVPTFLWPMAGFSATGDEDSISALGTLRQANSPGIIAAPPEPVPEVSALPCFII